MKLDTTTGATLRHSIVCTVDINGDSVRLGVAFPGLKNPLVFDIEGSLSYEGVLHGALDQVPKVTIEVPTVNLNRGNMSPQGAQATLAYAVIEQFGEVILHRDNGGYFFDFTLFGETWSTDHFTRDEIKSLIA